MDYESFLKGIMAAGIVVAAMTSCSYSADIRELKSENIRLIDQNISLQRMLVTQVEGKVSTTPQVTVPSDPVVTQLREGLQVSRDGLGIWVSKDDKGGYCTHIKYHEHVLMDECRPRQSRYTLLSKEAFGTEMFQEEWQQANEETGHSSGVTFWSVDDQELLQHLNLSTSRTLPACDPMPGGREVCYTPERWLKASMNLSDVEKPRLHYRYLTESGEAGEVNYIWDKKTFRLTGRDIPADIIEQYGL